MINLRRFLRIALPMVLLVAVASSSFAQEADADKAKAQLKQGIEEYNSFKFQAAKATLLRVDSKSLSDADKQKLNEYLTKVDVAIRMQRDAMDAYNDAEKALKNNELEKAQAGFEKAASSTYLPEQTVKDAKAQLAEVKARIELLKSMEDTTKKPAADTAETAKTDETAAEKPEATEEDENVTKMAADMAARREKAKSLVAEGQTALNDGKYKEAADFFEKALAIAPEMEEAQTLLNHARSQMTTEGSGGVLTNLQKKMRIAKEMAEIEFQDQMKKATEILARADSQAEFADAKEAALHAKNTLETNKTYYTADEYNERLTSVENKLKHIRDENEAWDKRQVAAKVIELKQAEEKRISEAALQRQQKIDNLTKNAKTLISERKYEEALELFDQILELDPLNSYAGNNKELVQQFAFSRQEGKLDNTYRVEEIKSKLAIRESEIPWYAELIYPEDWIELTLRREPFTAKAATESDEDRLVRQKMKQKIGKLEFSGIPFEEAVQFLRDFSGISIFVKWGALEAPGISKTTEVNVHLSDVMFEKALQVILEDVGGGTTQLGYVIDQGVITISTKEDLAIRTITRVYDIRDLIVRVPNFISPSIDMSQMGQNQGNNGGSGGSFFEENEGEGGISGVEEEQTKAQLTQKIITLITTTIDPESWRPEGETGSIGELNGQLIVTQTSENHEALMNLINQIREARALQISIEARFVKVSSGFLNMIGLDLDFYFNLGSALGSTTATDPWTNATVPTTGGTSGWGGGGNNNLTPMGVVQDLSFGDILGVSSGMANSIGSSITTSAMTVQGTYLDDIQVDFLLQATQADQSTRSLTAPRLTLFNGQRAYITVATQQAYVSEVEAVVAENAIAYDPTVSYVPTGTTLDVEATISADRRYVTLTVRPQIAQLDGEMDKYFTEVSTTDAEGNPLTGKGFVMLPTIIIQELQTTVSVPDGGTLLLGGQKLSAEVEREEGVPLLSKIPIVNRAFTKRGKVRDEETLLVLIKPKIIIQREEEEKNFGSPAP